MAEPVWIARSITHSPHWFLVQPADWVGLRQERDELSGRVGWLPGHIPEADLPPLPTEAVPEPEPLKWRPMPTCPRNVHGGLREDVWIAYSSGDPIRKFFAYSGLEQEHDRPAGRIGWLPGSIDRADLPEVPK